MTSLPTYYLKVDTLKFEPENKPTKLFTLFNTVYAHSTTCNSTDPWFSEFMFPVLQFSIVETVLTGVLDDIPALGKSKKGSILFRAGFCFVGFLLGLPMVTGVSFTSIVSQVWSCDVVKESAKYKRKNSILNTRILEKNYNPACVSDQLLISSILGLESR